MSKKGDKSAQQTAPKIKEPVPPPVFDASEWIKNCSSDPIAQFKLYPVEFYNLLKQQDFSILDEFNNEPIDQQVGKIAAEFDQATAESIFSSPSELVTQFRDYLRTYMQPKANAPIATVWPPIVPQVDDKFDTITVFLARIVRATKNPTLFLYWLSVEIFPTTFTRQTKFNALALCRCKEPKKKKELWAVLDGESVFHLYTFEKNEPKEVLKGNAVKTTIAADQLTVEIRGQDNKVISSFQPIDPQQVELWARAFDKDERPAIPFFCTSFATPIVDQFYGAMQQVCSNSDAAVLRACISEGVIPASSNAALGLTKAFTDIFVYSQRPTVLANAIISSELLPSSDFTKPMYTKHLFESFLVKFGTPYAQSFMARFISYVDSKADCGIGTDEVDLSKVEVMFFSALKYLMSSLPYVPPQVRFLFSVLRSHLTARDNTLGGYLTAASTIFREYVFQMLTDPGKICKVQNTRAVEESAKLLYVALSFGRIGGDLEKFSGMNDRLARHVFPKLRDFLLALGDLDEMPDFAPPNASELARSLEVVMKALAGCQEKFRPAYMAAVDPSNEQQKPSLLGSNYAAVVALFFKQSFDTLEVAEDVPEEGADADEKGKGKENGDGEDGEDGEKVKKHHHKLVKAELQPDASGVIRRIVRRDPNEVVDPSKPRKYYKRVVKHVPRE